MLIKLQQIRRGLYKFYSSRKLKTTMFINAVIIGVLVRIIIIQYISQGYNFYEGDLGITDIDYKVYLDSTTYTSPYQRHTYRYSPILSLLLTPSYRIGQNFGKYVFVIFDIIAMWFLFQIFDKRKKEDRNENITFLQSLIYSLNPFFIYITIRGNCQAITVALYFVFLYYYLSEDVNGNMSAFERRDKGLAIRQPNKLKKYFSYIIFGVLVHFRIFPIIFVPLMIMHEYYSVKKNNLQHIIKFIFQFGVISSGVFLILAYFFYKLYGYDFLHQTYFYHITRRDNRHSLSAFFYQIYLNYEGDAFDESIFRVIMRAAPRIIPILSSSFILVKRYSFFYCQAIILSLFVILNKIINGQYYMWLFCSFTLLHPQIEGLKKNLWSKTFLINIVIPYLTGFTCFYWQINANKLGVDEEMNLYTLWCSSLLLATVHIIGYCCYIRGIEPYKGQNLNQKSTQLLKRKFLQTKKQ